MSISLFACEAHGGTIITLDDELVVKDLAAEAGTGGNAFVPFILPNRQESSEAAEYSKLRRASQAVHCNGAVTVELTAYRDGNPTGQTIERDLTSADNPEVVAPFNTLATTHQVRVELSDFDAPVELGKARQWIVPRRSAR